LIETHNLHYAYPGGASLRFGDVHVPQGGILLVQGPSGAGKSTWLALLAGLLPAQGQLSVAGQDLRELQGAALDTWRGRTLGFLPQRLHLSPLLSVVHNLKLVYFAAGLPHDDVAIAQTLSQLQIADLAPRKPAQLSGGQAQRVALARALLLRPRVILADEPTASLDDEAAQQALQLLQQCASAQAATLVVATHDARAIAFFSGQSALQRLQIERGKL
jgi:putative ABC transport system ATP-binding protein